MPQPRPAAAKTASIELSPSTTTGVETPLRRRVLSAYTASRATMWRPLLRACEDGERWPPLRQDRLPQSSRRRRAHLTRERCLHGASESAWRGVHVASVVADDPARYQGGNNNQQPIFQYDRTQNSTQQTSNKHPYRPLISTLNLYLYFERHL